MAEPTMRYIPQTNKLKRATVFETEREKNHKPENVSIKNVTMYNVDNNIIKCNIQNHSAMKLGELRASVNNSNKENADDDA